MPPKQVAPPKQSDMHEGSELAQEVGPGPARLTHIDTMVSNLCARHERAAEALHYADLHLQYALMLLQQTAARVGRSRMYRPC